MQSLQSFILNTLYTKHNIVFYSCEECLPEQLVYNNIDQCCYDTKKFNVRSQTNSLDYRKD